MSNEQNQAGGETESTVDLPDSGVGETLLTQTGVIVATATTTTFTNTGQATVTSLSSDRRIHSSSSDSAASALPSSSDSDHKGLTTAQGAAVGVTVTAICILAALAALYWHKRRISQKAAIPNRSTRPDGDTGDPGTLDQEDVRDVDDPFKEKTVQWADLPVQTRTSAGSDISSARSSIQELEPAPTVRLSPGMKDFTHTRNASDSTLLSVKHTPPPKFQRSLSAMPDNMPKELQLPRPPQPSHVSQAFSSKSSSTSWYSRLWQKGCNVGGPY